MWASAKANLPRENKVGGHGRGTKLQGNKGVVEEEKQSTTVR